MITENAKPLEVEKPKTTAPLDWPDHWPPTSPEGRYKPGTFQDFVTNRDHLIKALNLLGAQKIVISSNVKVSGDGSPLAGNSDNSLRPGVSVRFEKNRAPFMLCQDSSASVAENLASLTRIVQAFKRLEDSGDRIFVQHTLTSLATPPSDAESTPKEGTTEDTETKTATETLEEIEADVVQMGGNDSGLSRSSSTWWELLKVDHDAPPDVIESAYQKARNHAIATQNPSLLYALEEAYHKALQHD